MAIKIFLYILLRNYLTTKESNKSVSPQKNHITILNYLRADILFSYTINNKLQSK